MLSSWESFSYFLISPIISAYLMSVLKMTRNTPQMLPYCQHCGEYKGVGSCKNPACDKTQTFMTSSTSQQNTKCTVCSEPGEYSCERCGRSFCEKHASERTEIHLVSIEQHIGTCNVCGKLVCEHCWILDDQGMITCIAHLAVKKRAE